MHERLLIKLYVSRELGLGRMVAVETSVDHLHVTDAFTRHLERDGLGTKVRGKVNGIKSHHTIEISSRQTSGTVQALSSLTVDR